MNEFEITLLREKIVIHDQALPGEKPGAAQMVASSNRMEAQLYDETHGGRETFIIRCQNMHMAIRMYARIVQTFTRAGPIINRPVPFDWEQAWKEVGNEYEEKYNPALWICIYNDGQIIFQQGEHHPFLDAIEKYNAQIESAYENAIPMAERGLRNAGKNIKIDQEGNLAMTARFEKTKGRCAIILRGPAKTTTFSYSMATNGGEKINLPQCLMVAAAFLEGVQLAFMVGMNDEKIKAENIDWKTDFGKQTKEARRRLGRLNTEVTSFENQHQVHYRPERPEFNQLIEESARLARKVFIRQPV